jgi:hypothetical protein
MLKYSFHQAIFPFWHPLMRDSEVIPKSHLHKIKVFFNTEEYKPGYPAGCQHAIVMRYHPLQHQKINKISPSLTNSLHSPDLPHIKIKENSPKQCHRDRIQPNLPKTSQHKQLSQKMPWIMHDPIIPTWQHEPRNNHKQNPIMHQRSSPRLQKTPPFKQQVKIHPALHLPGTTRGASTNLPHYSFPKTALWEVGQ